ncbi:peptide deformylase [Methylobacterium sp. Leaf456]|uniref:peptide deformylase n=1 Tax=Methylobacterium sp. Leaf456 TaxID=1736382 RepID=UPI0006FD3E45|nr:peptide deformylase [Methylobacterium sp. Leaf456]KQT60886.1 peptide deformylase [Methylobacterium sp. Leaf456]
MPVRPLVFHPDPRLSRPAAPMALSPDDVRALAGDVLDTLGEVGAMGLTAPHLGILERIVVIRLQPDEPAATYVDPVVVWASDERAAHPEGSVSMPGVIEPVERPARVRVRYRDLDGMEREEEVDGLRAACLQHEIDQLDGVFWTERLTRLRRDKALKRFAKLRGQAARKGA